MIGIMGAMSEEIDLIQAAMQVQRIKTIGRREFVEGTLHGIKTVLVFSRYGKVSAAITSALLIAHYDIAALIFFGVAGSADTQVKIGDVVIADHLVQHDMDCSPLFKQYEIPLLGVSTFETDKNLRSYAKQAAENYLENDFSADIGDKAKAFNIKSPNSHLGAIASGDQFIKELDYGASIKQGTQAILASKLLAFEMEGAAVAQACFELNKPFIVIRTISDNADHGAPIDFPQFIHSIARHYSCGIIKEFYKLLSQNELVENYQEKEQVEII